MSILGVSPVDKWKQDRIDALLSTCKAHLPLGFTFTEHDGQLYLVYPDNRHIDTGHTPLWYLMRENTSIQELADFIVQITDQRRKSEDTMLVEVSSLIWPGATLECREGALYASTPNTQPCQILSPSELSGCAYSVEYRDIANTLNELIPQILSTYKPD